MPKARSGGPTAVLTDKRIEPRIETSLSATVISGKRHVPFSIDNLSASGARLIGPLPLGIGDKIRLVLAFERGKLETIAEVVRVHSADLLTDQVAVRFIDLPTETEAAIRVLVLRNFAGAEGSEVDDERVTARLPRQAAAELEAATLRFTKKKKPKQ
jgi:hypothetical protein